MHNAAFAALGLDMVYVPLHVASDGVDDAVRGLRALAFVGANVTMPHKAAVIGCLDTVTDEAREVDAVNTIVVGDRESSGHNTDIPGFARALRDEVPEGVSGAQALLFGAGGAGRAAAFALATEDVAAITVVDRTVEETTPVGRMLRHAWPGVNVSGASAADVTAAMVADADVIVNATPLGMAGAGKVPTLLVDNIRSSHIVFDVVYGKRPTELFERARAVEARAVDGFSMLVWQAALAFELWTDRPAPADVMRRAAR
jgi:shikimate dehydrogenase